MRKHKKIQKPISYIMIVFLSLFCLFFLFLNIKVLKQRNDINFQANLLETETLRLLNEKNILEAEISETQKQEYLERVAREELNLKKEGETVIAFPLTEETGTSSIEEESFWQRILDKVR